MMGAEKTDHDVPSHDVSAAEPDASGDENMVGDKSEGDFPEGGLRAWMVVSGSSAIMFCGFGYLTGFG
jgi:hypothetical protein